MIDTATKDLPGSPRVYINNAIVRIYCDNAEQLKQTLKHMAKQLEEGNVAETPEGR